MGANDKRDATFHPALVAVHVRVMRQAICHSCGWEGTITDVPPEADAEADQHEREGCN